MKTQRKAIHLLTGTALAGAVLLPAGSAAADSYNVACDMKWHFGTSGAPDKVRTATQSFTLDNRQGTDTLDIKQTTTTTQTKEFAQSVNVSLSTSVAFGAFSAEMSAAYGLNTVQSDTVQKSTEIPMTAAPGEGFEYHIGVVMVRAHGYYERLSGCGAAMHYLQIGPVTEQAPMQGYIIWSEKLPPKKKASQMEGGAQ